MNYYFKNILRTGQTVIFFVFLTGTVAFVSGVFVFNKYKVQMEVLPVADSVIGERVNCYGNLGETLKYVLVSEEFLKGLNKNQAKEQKIIARDLEVERKEKTDILVIKVSDVSPQVAQEKISALAKYMIANSGKYFAKSDFVKVRTLMAPKLISKQKELFFWVLSGILIGLGVGGAIVWFTDFRLELWGRKKYAGGLVEQKIKEELIKKDRIKSELYPTGEEYVFKQKTSLNADVDIDRNSVSDSDRDIFEKKENKMGAVDHSSVSDNFQPKFVVLNQVLNDFGKKTLKEGKKKKSKESVPDNLPVFVNEDFELEERKNHQAKLEKGVVSKGKEKGDEKKEKIEKKGEKLTTKTVENKREKGIEKKRKEKSFMDSEIFKEVTRSVSKPQMMEGGIEEVIEEEVKEEMKKRIGKKKEGKKIGNDETKTISSSKRKVDGWKMGREKKPSAHNIANGFAVDTSSATDTPADSSEEIKDRLNKLLRGDL